MGVLDKRSRDDPRRHATEHAFLRATEALLAEGSSFADLNVRRVAERAGRTRTAFYAHFEDRRQLLLTLLDEAAGEGLAAIDPFLAGDGPVGRDELTDSLRGLLRAVRRHGVLVRAVVEAATYDDGVAEYWDGVIGRFIEGVGRRLHAEGVVGVEATAIATALCWMNERICYQQAVRGETGLDDDATVAALVEVWWSVLVAARAGSRDRSRPPGR